MTRTRGAAGRSVSGREGGIVRRGVLATVLLGIALIQIIVTSGCGPSNASPPDADEGTHVEVADAGWETELSAVPLGTDERLNVVATTSIVGDIVQRVGGDDIELTVMVRLGVDPHAFVPTPMNLAQISDADVVFANGVGLEEFLEPLLESADAASKSVSVS